MDGGKGEGGEGAYTLHKGLENLNPGFKNQSTKQRDF